MRDFSGLEIRPPKPGDFAQIREISRHCFYRPLGWVSDPEVAEHYRPGFEPRGRFGFTGVAVARLRGRVAAYLYYQWRDDGDFYVRELAAEPPARSDKVSRAGTILLASCLEHAWVERPSGRVTANVLAEQRARGDGGAGIRRDPVSYYESLGFVRDDDPSAGYTSWGKSRSRGDCWMTADLATALDRALSLVGSQRTRGLRASRRGAVGATSSGPGRAATRPGPTPPGDHGGEIARMRRGR